MTPTEMHIDALMEEALRKADELHEFEIEKYREVIEILKAENARYREALEYYASCMPWVSSTGLDEVYDRITTSDVAGFNEAGSLICGGRRARKALKGE